MSRSTTRAASASWTSARFDVVIELMPLLQGEIRVVSMTLEKPVVNVSVDAAGKVAWLSRAKLREPFDPDKVVLDNISIKDGALNYADAADRRAARLPGISAQLTARALLGPWHVDGSYLDDRQPGAVRHFHRPRARRRHDPRQGQTSIPARWPVTVSVDGPVGIDPAGGLTWHGTYSLAEVVAGGRRRRRRQRRCHRGGNAADGPTGWRSEGTFALTGDRLDIDKAVLSNGPADRPLSVAGTLSLEFRQDAVLLGDGGGAPDRSRPHARQGAEPAGRRFGGGRQPGRLAAASFRFRTSRAASASACRRSWSAGASSRMSASPRHRRRQGRLADRLAHRAAAGAGDARGERPDDDAGEVRLRRPGASRRRPAGDLRHLVARRAARQGAGRLLAPFDLSGHADIGPGRIAFDHVTAQIDDATITGGFGWAERPQGPPARALCRSRRRRASISSSSRRWPNCCVGRNLTNAGPLADSYSLHVKADAVRLRGPDGQGNRGQRRIRRRCADRHDAAASTTSAAPASKAPTARSTTCRAIRAAISTRPSTRRKLTGLARLADRFLPESGFTRWLDAAAPALGEAVIKNAKITAPLPDGGSGFAFTVDKRRCRLDDDRKAVGGLHRRLQPTGAPSRREIAAEALFAGQRRNWRASSASPPSRWPRTRAPRSSVQAKGVPADGLDTVVVTDARRAACRRRAAS